jgi:hypothetical protein
MKNIFTAFILFTSLNLFSQDTSHIYRWHNVDMLIRDRKIDKSDAIDSIAKFVPLAKKYFKSSGLTVTQRTDWVFPLSEFSEISYRTNGNDYKEAGFDYFQGGESKGHPAHDIFILDKDSNAIEDLTGNYVDAAAMVNGVVISLHLGWKKGDFFRSGNYVKLFDPQSEAIFYYSHLDSVFVNVGQIVKAGEPIGYVGRTGRKAIHGKTHLHIAYYKIEDGYPEPEDIIQDLYKAEKKIK